MRGIFCRGLRLELIAGLGLALAVPALALASESQGVATQTTLTAKSKAQAGHTQATVSVQVQGVDGQAASGAVKILDNGKQIAGVALDETGKATAALSLSSAEHSLTAVYAGDTTYRTSSSATSSVTAQDTTGTADFSLAVSPATLTLTAGNSGSVTLTVTPSNASALTSPMFVTLDCSTGLPDEASCTPYPSTIEILSTTTAAQTSTLTFVTNKSSGTSRLNQPSLRTVALALVFPGALGLMGLCFGGKRRRWISRISVLALLAVATMLGTTGCNPLYSYNKHTPDTSGATPTGSYTVTVSGQTTNGVTATSHTTSVALVVQ